MLEERRVKSLQVEYGFPVSLVVISELLVGQTLFNIFTENESELSMKVYLATLPSLVIYLLHLPAEALQENRVKSHPRTIVSLSFLKEDFPCLLAQFGKTFKNPMKRRKVKVGFTLKLWLCFLPL